MWKVQGSLDETGTLDNNPLLLYHDTYSHRLLTLISSSVFVCLPVLCFVPARSWFLIV